jgi:hypothetical protein
MCSAIFLSTLRRKFPGEAAAREAYADRRLGDVMCRAAWCTLPLWPDLRFEALIGPNDSILREWLIRPEAVSAPRLDNIADLTPWSYVVGDVAERSAPARHRPDTMPSY